MRTHRLDAAPGTVHWGFFDASLRPLITVEPGDEVIMSTVSGAPQAMPNPGSGLTVPAALSAIHASVPQKLNGPHIMTGPVAVRGARAGQVLEVRIKAIDLNYDWGYNQIRPRARPITRGFGEGAYNPYPAGPRAQGWTPAMGARNAAQAILRSHGRSAAPCLGAGSVTATAPQWRQHGQQGAGRRH